MVYDVAASEVSAVDVIHTECPKLSKEEEVTAVNIEAKREHAEEKALAKRRKKLQKKRQRACFWTSPLGHKYEVNSNRTESGDIFQIYDQCVGCDKKVRFYP